MAATLQFNYTGGASNSDGDASLGGTHSSNELSATALNNLFDDVTPTEATNGDTEYRAVDVTNTGDATATGVVFFMDPESTSADSQIDAGIESSSIDVTTSIADESTAPTGVTFVHYNSGSKLSLPDIPSGSYCRLWLRRVISAAAGNTSNDEGTLKVEYA